MTTRLRDARVLLYSHDTFGLGHLRRCRAIAHALVEAYSGMQVLIISGALIAGAFDYRARVDFVKVPSVIKLRNGEYTSLAEHVDLSDTLKMRRAMILETAQLRARPLHRRQEPMGLQGEIEGHAGLSADAGHAAGPWPARGDGFPGALGGGMGPQEHDPRIREYFDDIWVYGPRGSMTRWRDRGAQDLRERMTYGLSETQRLWPAPRPVEEPYILVTPAAAAMAPDLVRSVIEAYCHHPELPSRGDRDRPYMPGEQRHELQDAPARTPSSR